MVRGSPGWDGHRPWVGGPVGGWTRVSEFGLEDDESDLLGGQISAGAESALREEFRTADCWVANGVGTAGQTVGAMDCPLVCVGWAGGEDGRAVAFLEGVPAVLARSGLGTDWESLEELDGGGGNFHWSSPLELRNVVVRLE